MYKLPLKIMGLVFGITLIILSFFPKTKFNRDWLGAVDVSEYHDGINIYYTSNLGSDYTFGYRFDIIEYNTDNISLSEMADFATLDNINHQIRIHDILIDIRLFIKTIILIIPGIAITILSICIKTPFEEKLIAKMKKKSKNKKMSKVSVRNVQTNVVCPCCNAEIGINSKFCLKCGTPIYNSAVDVQRTTNYQ